MNKTIHLLSEITINQIAAGEVIENPASVIKELVDNSIDAGASLITVETKGGGLQWIKISDNGCGMSPEDAVLCLQRHATSKIVNTEDLLSLTTMGFRGEALASIAAISKLEILTCKESATYVKIEGGKIESVHPHARVRGTTIEVSSLFYNVPARKAFQKSASASSSEITRMLTELALGHPHIGFTLIQQGKEIFSVPKQSSLMERAELLLGKEFVQNCKKITLSHPECRGEGLISFPEYTRHNRSGQHLFINSRPIHCLPITFAVKEGYGTSLNTGEHPLYLLHLNIPSEDVDVNVHPQKKEVRLKKESVIRYALQSAIQDVLHFSSPPKISFSDFTPLPFVLREEPRQERVSQITLPISPSIQPIGLYKEYLLCYSEEGIAFFHLPSCKKQLLSSKMMQDTSSSQHLLLPLALSFSFAETEKLITYLPLLQHLGLQIEQAGKTGFIVSTLPSFMEENEVLAFLNDLLQSENTLCKEDVILRLTKPVLTRRTSYSLGEAIELVKASHTTPFILKEELIRAD